MGYGVSHQQVGINRCGEYLKTARTKGPANDPVNDPPLPPLIKGGRTAEGASRPGQLNEPWRRISDLVGVNAETRDPKLRKRCVRKLVAWIERKWRDEFSKERGAERKIQLTEGWDWDLGDWRGVDRGVPLEGICFRLGMSARALTGLLKETHGISAGELLDGFRVRNLRGCLIGQLRMAAQRLWDSPGEFAKRRCMRPHTPAPSPFHGDGENGDPPWSPLIKGGKTAGAALRAPGKRGASRDAKRSKYFRTQAWEFLGLEEGEDQRRRVEELLGMLDRVREENDFSLDAFAASLGFESARNFRRACLNVMGRTLEQLERILAREVVDYYLAAEERVLREICFRDDEFGFRAREIYCGDAEKFPTDPFCDLWSAWEQCKPEWIGKMRDEFG
jgi:hypothetical protein